jgi:hypothetical protein
MKARVIKSAQLLAGKMRMEGNFHLNEYSLLSSFVEENRDKCIELGDVALVFNPGIFKRLFCTSRGKSVQYFQSSDVPYATENSNTYISKEQVENSNLLVRKDDILVTGFGSIGNTRIVSKYQHGVCYANNVCRIRVLKDACLGYIYTILTSKYGVAQLNKNASGSVVRYIEAPGIKRTLIPVLSHELQVTVNQLIKESVSLREVATEILKSADTLLKQKAGLKGLSPEDYDYFGQHSADRKVSCFTRDIKDIGITTINAFNHSERIRNLVASIPCTTRPLKEVLQNGQTFSTGSFPRIEVKKGCGIMLINQSDIFDSIIKGKYISMRNVKISNLVEYGEILIAGVGTLGESETFCRAIFANEDLQGQLVSGEFIRMKTTEDMPSGYLFAWLNTDYGFRLIRNTQAGTKLCRPIPRLFIEIPVPIIDIESMMEIDRLVREAHTKRHEANVKELKAIKMVEDEIEKWNK